MAGKIRIKSGICPICQCERERLHRDHIYPKWKCRRDDWTIEQIENLSNIQYICALCHDLKTVEDKKDFIATTEMREKISRGNLGLIRTEATKRKMSEASKGRVFSDEWRARIREGKLNKTRRPKKKAPIKRPIKSGICPICQCERERLHRDHIYPKWKCRRDDWTIEQIENLSNIQYICALCHDLKTTEENKDFVISKETRTKLSIAHTGKIRSAEHNRKLGEARRGKSLSPEHILHIKEGTDRQRARPGYKENLIRTMKERGIRPNQKCIENSRLATTGKPLSEEHKAKLRAVDRTGQGKGRTHSLETKLKMAQAHRALWAARGQKGRPLSLETKLKIGRANRALWAAGGRKGHPHSLETKLKMAQAHRAIWAARREGNSMAECDLAKVEVVGSSPIPRSTELSESSL